MPINAEDPANNFMPVPGTRLGSITRQADGGSGSTLMPTRDTRSPALRLDDRQGHHDRLQSESLHSPDVPRAWQVHDHRHQDDDSLSTSDHAKLRLSTGHLPHRLCGEGFEKWQSNASRRKTAFINRLIVGGGCTLAQIPFGLTPAPRTGHYHRPCRFMRHTISILVENKFGVLARIAGMFSGRGFNIDTLERRSYPGRYGLPHDDRRSRRRQGARASH